MDNPELNEESHSNNDKTLHSTRTSMSERKSLILKYINTAAICYGEFAYGLVCLGLFGPTLIDLSLMHKSDVNTLSLIFTLTSGGYTIGSLFGLVYRHFNRQALLAVLQVLIGVTVGVLPQCRSLTWTYIVSGILGLTGGAWDCGEIVWTIDMWKDKSGPFLQAGQFLYSVGFFVGPLICKPFISSNDTGDDDNGLLNSTNIDPELIRSRLTVPFAIIGAISISAGIFIALLFVYSKSIEDKNVEINQNENSSLETPKNNRQMSRLMTYSIVAIGGILLSSYISIETLTINYIPSFAHFSSLHISNPDAAVILSVMGATYAIGRGLSIITFMKFKPQYILCVHFALVLIGNIIILSLGNTNKIALWSGAVILGSGFSGVYPGVYAFLEQYIQIGNIFGTIFIFSAGLSIALWPIYVGKIIETTPMILFVVCMGNLAIALIMFIVISILMHFRNRFVI